MTAPFSRHQTALFTVFQVDVQVPRHYLWEVDTSLMYRRTYGSPWSTEMLPLNINVSEVLNLPAKANSGATPS